MVTANTPSSGSSSEWVQFDSVPHHLLFSAVLMVSTSFYLHLLLMMGLASAGVQVMIISALLILLLDYTRLDTIPLLIVALFFLLAPVFFALKAQIAMLYQVAYPLDKVVIGLLAAVG